MPNQKSMAYLNLRNVYHSIFSFLGHFGRNQPLNFLKVVIRPQTIFVLINRGTKNAEFDASVKPVEKVTKKFTKNVISHKI
jgi:hypothetical protein